MAKKEEEDKPVYLIPRLLPEAIETLGRGGPHGKVIKPKYKRRPKHKRADKGEE